MERVRSRILITSRAFLVHPRAPRLPLVYDTMEAKSPTTKLSCSEVIRGDELEFVRAARKVPTLRGKVDLRIEGYFPKHLVWATVSSDCTHSTIRAPMKPVKTAGSQSMRTLAPSSSHMRLLRLGSVCWIFPCSSFHMAKWPMMCR